MTQPKTLKHNMNLKCWKLTALCGFWYLIVIYHFPYVELRFVFVGCLINLRPIGTYWESAY